MGNTKEKLQNFTKELLLKKEVDHYIHNPYENRCMGKGIRELSEMITFFIYPEKTWFTWMDVLVKTL